jgi:hypothetical protein
MKHLNIIAFRKLILLRFPMTPYIYISRVPLGDNTLKQKYTLTKSKIP